MNLEEQRKEFDVQDGGELKVLISQHQSDGWMTDVEWKKFGRRKACLCVDLKVMRDIAGRWDANRLEAFPRNSKFERTREKLPPGQEHYIITASDWRLTMAVFCNNVLVGNYLKKDKRFFCMWKLENGKGYIDWCKSSYLRKN